MKRFSAPKYFTENYISEFLTTSEPIFDLKEKMVPNVVVDVSTCKEISIIGLLLIYKFIDYTYQNHCFKRPNLLAEDFMKEAWRKYEFTELIKRYISNKDITEPAYKDFKVKIEDSFIIAPQPLLRSEDYSRETLVKDFLPQLNTYYRNDEKVVLMIFTCLSEMLLNFWEHAVDDNRSIIIANGNDKKIEIACADTGDGLISTLKRNPKYKKLRPNQVLQRIIDKGVTSKENTNHMGYGLWIINEIASLVRGKFYLFSQGQYLKNDFGKIRHGECAYWQGTIVYLSLPLMKPFTFSDLQQKLDEKNRLSNIKIKFV